MAVNEHLVSGILQTQYLQVSWHRPFSVNVRLGQVASGPRPGCNILCIIHCQHTMCLVQVLPCTFVNQQKCVDVWYLYKDFNHFKEEHRWAGSRILSRSKSQFLRQRCENLASGATSLND